MQLPIMYVINCFVYKLYSGGNKRWNKIPDLLDRSGMQVGQFTRSGVSLVTPAPPFNLSNNLHVIVTSRVGLNAAFYFKKIKP